MTRGVTGSRGRWRREEQKTKKDNEGRLVTAHVGGCGCSQEPEKVIIEWLWALDMWLWGLNFSLEQLSEPFHQTTEPRWVEGALGDLRKLEGRWEKHKIKSGLFTWLTLRWKTSYNIMMQKWILMFSCAPALAWHSIRIVKYGIQAGKNKDLEPLLDKLGQAGKIFAIFTEKVCLL